MVRMLGPSILMASEANSARAQAIEIQPTDQSRFDHASRHAAPMAALGRYAEGGSREPAFAARTCKVLKRGRLRSGLDGLAGAGSRCAGPSPHSAGLPGLLSNT